MRGMWTSRIGRWFHTESAKARRQKNSEHLVISGQRYS